MATPRVTVPVRNQGEIQFVMPEDALPPEHPARVLWSVISRLDLSAFLADAGAFEGGSGRPTTSPRMLLTLWTYAISRGVGSAVTDVGSDMGTLAPMVEQLERRIGALPEHVLADANHANHEAISALIARGVDVLVPVPERTRATGGTPEIQAWKERMASKGAKELYRARASLCELTNANARRMGMTQFLVRGVAKTTSVALLTAITHDLLVHATTLLA
jgi:hypothetical protein